MSVNLVINGITYPYPETGEENWGDNATNWAVAVTSGMLQKSGGLFTLTAEVDFGATFGVASLYYKSRSANLASAGQIRLANTDEINWRNSTNSADLILKPDPSNDGVLLYNNDPIASAANPNFSTDITINDGSESIVISKLNAVTLTDAATTNVFSIPASEARNFSLDFSILRGSDKETGRILVTSDGTNAQVNIVSVDIGSTGTTFEADIDSGNVRLRATTSSTGSDAELKYHMRRWND